MPANKTRNLYAVSKPNYETLLRENITNAYKLAPAYTYVDINKEAKGIAQRLESWSRLNCMARNEAFITLNDYEYNFSNALPCRLTNPAKNEIGTRSKTTLDRILTAVNQKLQLNRWKNTASVTDWFSNLQRTQQCPFSASTLSTSILHYH